MFAHFAAHKTILFCKANRREKNKCAQRGFTVVLIGSKLQRQNKILNLAEKRIKRQKFFFNFWGLCAHPHIGHDRKDRQVWCNYTSKNAQFQIL